MLIVCADTIRNKGALETRSLPKKFFGRVQLIPRGASVGLWGRLIVEMQLVRYLSALLPFAILPFMSANAALGVTQAPLAMVVVIGFVELRVLRLTDKQRERLMDADEAARRTDTLTFRARAALRQIAARRGIDAGELTLVVEQSDLARIAPLTFVSVQTAEPDPHLIPLDAGDRAVLDETLFDEAFSERDLLAVNQFAATFVREVKQDARGVSAHARLAAALERRAVSAPAEAGA
ncbi:MAG: hypothetical protein AAF376_14185 [Pseudomonadota bacterium]